LQDATFEQSNRYNDILRSINNTEQFIKAKQAIAALDREKKMVGRNAKRNQYLSEVPILNNQNFDTNQSTLEFKNKARNNVNQSYSP